jgi:AcrR family transcriptional regulator
VTSSAAATPGPQDPSVTPRSTYHHGDLRRALLEAGTELAREGGPDKVVLREATRRVGVSANAAYRHFADREALVSAVAAVALRRLAQAMLERIEALPTMAPPRLAGAALGEVGRAYVEFAIAEPGLFHTAFAPRTRPELDGPGPHEVLTDALDECVRTGMIAPAKREWADRFCWSAVHGFAELHVGGPLAAEPPGALAAGLDGVLARIGDALFSGDPGDERGPGPAVEQDPSQ